MHGLQSLRCCFGCALHDFGRFSLGYEVVPGYQCSLGDFARVKSFSHFVHEFWQALDAFSCGAGFSAENKAATGLYPAPFFGAELYIPSGFADMSV